MNVPELQDAIAALSEMASNDTFGHTVRHACHLGKLALIERLNALGALPASGPLTILPADHDPPIDKVKLTDFDALSILIARTLGGADWAAADDETIVEEFDPWSVLRALAPETLRRMGRGSPSNGFVGVGRKVMKGADYICEAVSYTYAKRIANALNLYKPSRRGQ